MKISQRVMQEIDFLCTYCAYPKPYTPTRKEVEDYVSATVLGTKKENQGGMSGESSVLFQAKRNLDMTIKMWRRDLLDGLLSFDELVENYGNSIYGLKLVHAIRKGINFAKYVPRNGVPEITAANILFH